MALNAKAKMCSPDKICHFEKLNYTVFSCSEDKTASLSPCNVFLLSSSEYIYILESFCISFVSVIFRKFCLFNPTDYLRGVVCSQLNLKN